ncbi:NAD(P)H-dependent oxidoreductase [Staphylococcus simulans]|uniref:NAD(P)H-dependent oxidoreductase n=1 Tax=Staphylococcus simulans TaxID=1286 RepID=UPI000D1EF65C|nr:NAD(P)H-dependent oxidoreductase [Staphylococcus simulans]MDY5061048.1 NAD(P)H-dependent oxidoreductase [Staphylococcus simulans]PTJ15138.1 flavodoxin family protein [Staphylococcus simulans]
MSTLVIIAHPDIQEGDVNQVWKKTLEDRSDLVTVHDLYQTYPDGNIDVEYEQDLLQKHDHIIFQYPMFWMSYPPLLQQWFDEVYTHGFAFDGGDALKGKYFALAISCGQPQAHYKEDGPIGYTIDEICNPLKGVVNLVGGHFFGVHAIYQTDDIDNFATLAENADEYISFVERLQKQ